MKNKYFYIVMIIALIITLTINYPITATEQESNNFPMNFKINMLPWEEVKNLIPNKTNFTIIDVETGLSFHVQRRAGKNHADVQPLTKKDTQIMKKIYDNSWSWKRRAILVEVNGQFIAASMHGMPHGAGALNNGFPGHFCVHFFGSRTHTSNKEDLSHQIMVLKAGHKLDDYFDKVTPKMLIQTFAIAVNQEDYELMELTLSKSDNHQQFNKLIQAVQSIDISEMELTKAQSEGRDILLIKIPVTAYITSREMEMIEKTILFTVQRTGLMERWQIDVDSLYAEFKE